MKIFEGNKSSYGSKINFVDDNDVFVGYDMEQDCCEDAGWFIAKEIISYSYDKEPEGIEEDLENYFFDRGFMEYKEGGSLDCGAMVIFKLIAEDNPDLYLHIYNAHNGYYAHGLEYNVNLKEEQYYI